jgi:hypothetical protein
LEQLIFCPYGVPYISVERRMQSDLSTGHRDKIFSASLLGYIHISLEVQLPMFLLKSTCQFPIESHKRKSRLLESIG